MCVYVMFYIHTIFTYIYFLKNEKLSISVCEGCDVNFYLIYFTQWKICISSVEFYLSKGFPFIA